MVDNTPITWHGGECTVCDGSGMEWDVDYMPARQIICPYCDGTGRVGGIEPSTPLNNGDK